MIHQKDGGQVGQTISDYPALRDPARRDKILEKLGEGGMSQNSLRTICVSSWNFADPAEGGRHSI